MSFLLHLIAAQEPSKLPGLPNGKIEVLASSKKGDRAVILKDDNEFLATRGRTGWRLTALQKTAPYFKTGELVAAVASFDLVEDAFLLVNRRRAGVNSTNGEDYVYKLTPTGCKLLKQPYSSFDPEIEQERHGWILKSLYGRVVIRHRGKRVEIIQTSSS